MKAKSLLFYLLTLCLPVSASAAGIPVLDVSNLGQTTMTAIEAVKQTAKQVQQYALQLQQFENMVKNTIAPAAYVWSEVGLMQNKMFSIQDQYNYYKNGGIEKYLNRFGNVNYYRDSENFDLDMFLQNRAEAIDSSKKANDSLAKTIDQQRSDLRKEAADLESSVTGTGLFRADASSPRDKYASGATKQPAPATPWNIADSGSGHQCSDDPGE